MSYFRYEATGATVSFTGVVPPRGLLATIDVAQGYRVTPAQALTHDEWDAIDAHLRFGIGLKKQARRAAMTARWGDSEAFLVSLYALQDPRVSLMTVARGGGL